ncbi:MAG TPA: transcriptional repressor [Actinomycetota bacterium]|nr:transcriptional repressor [Actinomycetota bacterium]
MVGPGPVSRATRQRAALAALMDDVDSFLSAQEVHALLRQRDAKVGLTTVYRNLQAMADRGEVDMVRRADGEALYRKCATEEHHHHLVCRNCGFSVEVGSDELERWTKKAARRHGFSDISHDLEIFGLCEACSRR